MPRGKALNLTGMQFGRLRVLHIGNAGKRKGRWWLCKCECGKEKLVRADNLTKGRTVSCGCFLKDMQEGKVKGKRAGRPRKYGSADVDGAARANPGEYESWRRMIGRCQWTSARGYEACGGAGVRVCQRWMDSFEAFLEDVGKRPHDGAVLLRRNPDGDYSPENVRWGTRREVAESRRAPPEEQSLFGDSLYDDMEDF